MEEEQMNYEIKITLNEEGLHIKGSDIPNTIASGMLRYAVLVCESKIKREIELSMIDKGVQSSEIESGETTTETPDSK